MRLLTNLLFVQLEVDGHALRLNCRALLLEERDPLFSGGSPRYCIRGFGTDSAWEVFALWLHCGHLDYELTVAASNNFVIMSDATPEGRPIFSGAMLEFKDGTKMFIQVEDQVHPLDISDHSDYEALWVELGARVRQYYTPPLFPLLTHVPKALAQPRRDGLMT